MKPELSAAQIAAFRDRACRVAIEQLAERERHKVSMRSVAAELGCSPMTPYRYFESKEELFAASRAFAFRELTRHFAPALGVVPPLERLEALGAAYFEFAREHPHLYRLVFDFSHANEHEHPELVREVASYWATMDEVMRDVVNAGFLTGEPTMLNHLFWSGMHGAVSLHMTRKVAPACDFDTLCTELVRVLYRGLRSAQTV